MTSCIDFCGKFYNLQIAWGHSIITFALRGERGAKICKEREGVSHQCKCLHLNFFIEFEYLVHKLLTIFIRFFLVLSKNLACLKYLF